MAEVTNELIYEGLKSVQSRLGNVDDRLGAIAVRMDTLGEQMRTFTLSLNATNTDVANLYRMFGTMDHRLACIERRLEISDEPVK